MSSHDIHYHHYFKINFITWKLKLNMQWAPVSRPTISTSIKINLNQYTIDACIHNIMFYQLGSILLLTTLIKQSEQHENCCQKKIVGGKSYTLVQSGEQVPSRCKNSCVYQEDGKSSQVCFAPGDLKVTCHNGHTPTFGKSRKIMWNYIINVLLFSK